MSDNDEIDLDGGVPCDADPRVKIDEGIYTAQCESYTAKKFRGGVRLFLTFFVFKPDSERRGWRLFESFNLGSDGSVRSPDCKFYREWSIANHGERPRRNDRMSCKVFKGHFFRVRVRTVLKNAKGEDHEQPYSVVSNIIELIK